MKLIDKLASPTLAHLYLSQGHFERANETLDRLLASKPSSGEVLALRDRLRHCNTSRLQSKIRGRSLQLSWSIGHLKVSAEHSLILELAIFRPTRFSAASAESQTIAIPGGKNRHTFSLPEGPASACARLCLEELTPSANAVKASPRLRTLAISRIHSW